MTVCPHQVLQLLATVLVVTAWSTPRPQAYYSWRSTTTTTTTTRLLVTTKDQQQDSSFTTEPPNNDKEEQFLQNCKLLCHQRNLPLEKVKNARDLASVHNSPIQPGRLFRTGRLSDASDQDIQLLMQTMNLVILIMPFNL